MVTFTNDFSSIVQNLSLIYMRDSMLLPQKQITTPCTTFIGHYIHEFFSNVCCNFWISPSVPMYSESSISLSLSRNDFRWLEKRDLHSPTHIPKYSLKLLKLQLRIPCVPLSNTLLGTTFFVSAITPAPFVRFCWKY